MAGPIPQAFIDDLNSRVDVLEVISSRIDVKKKGKDHWACCPFHNESTPSFSINPQKQFYYCFGCGASGSALNFVQEYDGLSFPEAVESLAKSVGMEVPRNTSEKEIKRFEKKKQLHTIVEQVSDYYYSNLTGHQDRHLAIDYLKQRGLTGHIVKEFQIGFSPSGWDNVLKGFGKKEEQLHQLLAAGLLIEKQGGEGGVNKYYDRFRERVMFPIRNPKGKTIGFGGRVLGDQKPKYLNSPETELFVKNQELYGLYEIKKRRRECQRIVIVEGYMDVVSLFQAGVDYAVATLGTATSAVHIQTLFKLVDEIVFCFDGDAAGLRAAKRAFEQCLPLLQDGWQVKFLFLDQGEDPDTIVKKIGQSGFERLLDRAQTLSDYMLDSLQSQVDFESEAGRAKMVQLAKPMMQKIQAQVFRQLLQKRLSVLIGLELDFFAEQGEQGLPMPVSDAPSSASFGSKTSAPKKNADQVPMPFYGGMQRIQVSLNAIDRILSMLIYQPSMVTYLDMTVLVNSEFDCQVLEAILPHLRKLKVKDFYHAYSCLQEQGLDAKIKHIIASDYFWLPKKLGYSEQQLNEELQSILSSLSAAQPTQAYELLKQRVLARDPSLSDEDKMLYKKLLKERK